MSSSPPRQRQQIDSSASSLPVAVESSRFRPYSDLPMDMLHEICRRTVSFRSYLGMCRVCKHWRHSLLQYPFLNLRSEYPCFNPIFPPYLLLPRDPLVARIECHDVFGNAYGPIINFPWAAHDLVDWSIACNQSGWLVMVKKNLAVIWNCLSNHRFSLPPLPAQQTISKILLPPHVDNETKIAAIICGRNKLKTLVFCRICDSSWTYFPNLPHNRWLCDILYMHGYVFLFEQLEADDNEMLGCVLVTLDPETLEARTFDFNLPLEAIFVDRMYLCSSGSELYIILRLCEGNYDTDDSNLASGFMMFSVRVHVDSGWVETRSVKILDNACLFVGRDFCAYMSVPASKTLFCIEQYQNPDKSSKFFDVCDVYSACCDLETDDEDQFSIVSTNQIPSLTNTDYVIGKSTRPMWFVPHMSGYYNEAVQ